MASSSHHMRVSRRHLLQGGACLFLANASTVRARASALPFAASAFLDSVGVNTHLDSDPYRSQFETVGKLLSTAGLRHVRDEIRPTNDVGRWRALFDRHQVRGHMLISPATNTIRQMSDYIATVGVERISAIEGQNEGDSDWFMGRAEAGRDWSATVVAYQREAYGALRAMYSKEQLPVVSPTVIDWKTGDMRKLTGAASYCDVVAIHSYVQGAQEPETADPYAALSWYLEELQKPFKPGAPVMSTETGYNTSTRQGGSGVSETAAASYLPRLLLHYFSSGVERTFLYELMDGGQDPSEWEDHYGLVYSDGSPKPAYGAIAALLGAMRELEGGPEGRRLPYAAIVADAHEPVRILPFQGRGGGTLLAIWRPVRCWDVAAGKDIDVPPLRVTVTLDRPARADALRLNAGGAWSAIAVSNRAMTLDLDANVTLVRLHDA